MGIETELGIWLSGIQCFITSGPNAFFAGGHDDRAREARILHGSLLRVSMLAAMSVDPVKGIAPDVAAGVGELSRILRDAIYTGESLINDGKLSIAGYNSWCQTLADRLGGCTTAELLIGESDREGDKNLPPVLTGLLNKPELDPQESELALVLPRFGRILAYLEIIGSMLERDEPLKPTILLFTRVNELIHDLTTFINNRLERFPDREAEIYGTLDAASYTASMEMKKVYSQELAGVAQVRTAPSIYARTETAYASLSDGFKLILSGFARIVDPTSDMFTVFPEFQVKRDQSIALRHGLLELTKTVNAAENEPESANVERLNTGIREFMREPVTYLFFKDTETIERFVEEITTTRNSKDLVPLLHRFGAYLDTLLGQVALRSVLSDVPLSQRSL